MKRQYRKGQEIQLTAHFSLKDFECHCSYTDCQWTIIDTDHIALLEAKRVEIGKPFIVDDGYRCEKHNKDVGGASASQHPQGLATDIKCPGLTPEELSAKCESFNGKGLYDTFVHVDSRPLVSNQKPARWDLRVKK